MAHRFQTGNDPERPNARREPTCSGVYPMMFTAFDRQGRLNRLAIERMAEAAIFAGVHGVAILGEIAEVGRLSIDEQRRVMAWVAEHIDGRVRLCVSISGADVPSQVDMLRAAKDVGASWAMLQPPPLPGLAGPELLRFFGRVADKVDLPICIRNVPSRLGLSLTGQELRRLRRSSPNVVAVKLEADAISVASLVAELEGEMEVLNGRGGLEMTDCLRAGATCIMPGIECIDVVSSIFIEMQRPEGRGEARADELMGLVAPLFVFLSGPISQRLLYGKMLVSRRLRLKSIVPRPPFNKPHPFGISVIERWAERLGPLPYDLAWPRKALKASSLAR